MRQYIKWFLLLLLAIIWGGSFFLMVKGMEVFTSEQVAALRIFIAFLFLAPLLIKHYKIDFKKYWLGILMMSLFGNFIPAFLFTKAETAINSSMAGMLNSLTPLFTILIGVFIFKVKTHLYQVLGILIGFLGAIFLIWVSPSDNKESAYWGCFLVILATLCYAVSVNSIRKFLGDLNSTKATVWAFTISGPICFVYLCTTDVFTRIQTNPNTYNSLSYIAILAIVGSAISVILFNELIKMAGSVFASSCTYLIPFFAIIYGHFLLGDDINTWQIMAVAIILGGIWLVNKSKV